MITDYLQGINRATSGEKTDVKTATDQLSTYQAGAGSLPAKLKEALNLKLNNNRDIIEQQSETMGNYFNSGAVAREKYKDVWDPFQKAKLVQQDRTMALRPYDTLSGVLENRMGSVADIVNAGVSGWKGLVDSATTKLDTAKSMLSTALQSYLSASSQQQAADDMAFKIAQAEEATRQFEKSYGLDVQKFDEGVRQFNIEAALKRAGIGASGARTVDEKNQLTDTIWQTINKNPDGTPASPSQIWQSIHNNEASWSKLGVNMDTLWAGYHAMGGTNTPAKPAPKANGFLSNFFNGNSGYANSQTDLSGYNLKLR